MATFHLPTPLVRDVQEGRCLPIVGSGLSRNASLPAGTSMPDWQGLTRELAREGQLGSKSDGPKLAEEFVQEYGRVELIETIRRALHGEQVKPGKSHLALVRLPFETIYTTNYDSLLEQACAIKDLPHRSVVSDKQLPFHGGRGVITVVKMHGDLTHEEQIVVTSTDYRDYERSHLLVSTHLSGLLVTKTPLLLGYSAKDPDLLHILEVIDSRLGDFRRMGYTVRVRDSQSRPLRQTTPHFRALEVRLDKGETPDEALTALFEALGREVDAAAVQIKTNSHPNYFETLEPTTGMRGQEPATPPGILAKLSVVCYVSMISSRATIELFREVLEPVIMESGMTPLRSEDLPESENPLESIRSTILLSKMCVFLWSRPSSDVQYDLSVAVDAGRPIVFLAPREMDIPKLAHGLHVVRYTHDGAADLKLQLNQSIQSILFDQNVSEARGLIAKGEARAAIVSLSVALETILRAMLSAREFSIRDEKARRPYGLRGLINVTHQAGLIDRDTFGALGDMVEIRNRAAHSPIPSSVEAARKFLSLVLKISERFSQWGRSHASRS